MPATKEQIETLHDIHAQIQLSLDSSADGGMQDDAFCQYVIDLLEHHDEGPGGQALMVDEGRAGFCSGWCYDDDTESLTIYYSKFNRENAVEEIGIPDVRAAFSKVIKLLKECDKGYHLEKEPASSVFAFGEELRSLPKGIKITLAFLTNALAKQPKDDFDFRGKPVKWVVWDLEKIDRLRRSGKISGPIVIDLMCDELGSKPLPLLGAPWQDDSYDAYVGIIPAWVLGKIYREHGSRLMERNVRAYLENRGKVNKGIMKTLATEPGRFLAYNNGLCATAAAIEGDSLGDGIFLAKRIVDFQIVNGGQTTATIARVNCEADERVGLSSVQLKLSVIRDKATASEMVSKIALYANSQNKVNESSFASNGPYFLSLEKLSRSAWTPVYESGGRQTKWYFERAAGSYRHELARLNTDRERREFERQYPVAQWFVMTDHAKYEMVFKEMPHIACLGREKCFGVFSQIIKGIDVAMVDIDFYQNVVAKAIIFRQGYAIIKEVEHAGMNGYGNLRSQVTAYTISFIIHLISGKIDLNLVWKSQKIDNNFACLLPEISRMVHDHLIKNTNLASQRAKSEKCWDEVKAGLLSEVGRLSASSLTALEKLRASGSGKGIAAVSMLSGEEVAMIDRVVRMGHKQLDALLSWAREIRGFSPPQIGNARKVMGLLVVGERPSFKQASQVERLLTAAQEKGFAYRCDLGQA